MSRVIFLRWWLFFMATIVACIFAWHLGGFHEVNVADATPCSYIIYAIVLFGSFWCGWKTWKISSLVNKGIAQCVAQKDLYSDIKRNSEIGWFAADNCLTVGMIGTVIGFIMMFREGDFTSVDVSNVKSMLGLIGAVAKGMSTALYTTLVGLIGSSILKVQYFNLDHALESVSPKEGK